ADRAGVGPQQTLNRAEGGCLPSSVRAQQAKDLALADFEGHAINRPLWTITHMEVFDLKSQIMRRSHAGGRLAGSHTYGLSDDTSASVSTWLWELDRAWVY